MKTLALERVLTLSSVVTAKPREWKNATVAAIAVGSADNDGGRDARRNGAARNAGLRSIALDIASRQKHDLHPLDGVGQFLYSREMKAVVFCKQNINGQGCTIKP